MVVFRASARAPPSGLAEGLALLIGPPLPAPPDQRSTTIGAWTGWYSRSHVQAFTKLVPSSTRP